MKKLLAVMISLCCLVAFSSVSMAESKKTNKKDNNVVQEKQTSVKGEAVNRGDEENARKNTTKKNKPNKPRSSEHGTIRGTINGGGDMI